MSPTPPTLPFTDHNTIVAGWLRDMALAQSARQKTFGYKRAAAAVFALRHDVRELFAGETPPRINGVGPASTRIIREVLDSGSSPTVERDVASSPNQADILRRRGLRDHVLSQAAVFRILADESFGGLLPSQHRADFQMHSLWSDGNAALADLAHGCRTRHYRCAAVTDHSHGLKIAGGMSMEDAARQRQELDALNRTSDDFYFFQGIEANIDREGGLDLTDDEAAVFDLVLAAPHSRLRVADDQTARILRAIAHPSVRILAHPRGRISGSRPGLTADWPTVFAEAARRGVAIEIDGDPARQDLDFTLARQALDAGCIFALDSDAHTVGQLWYVETAIAHARLAAIPAERIINCWEVEHLRAWLAAPASESAHARHGVAQLGEARPHLPD